MRPGHFFFYIGLTFPLFSQTALAAGPYPVTIDLIPQTVPYYMGFYLDSSSSTVPVDMSFTLLNNTNPAVIITPSSDPKFPTTFTATLNPNSHCTIWVFTDAADIDNNATALRYCYLLSRHSC